VTRKKKATTTTTQVIPRTKGDVKWLLAITLVVIASGMAYSIWWPPAVRHRSFYWLTPGDTWYMVRTAHWISWGSLSYVYSNYRSELIALPGFHLLLAPVVMLSSALHLSEIAPGIPGPLRPTEWLLVGPFTLAMAGVLLFSLDALARRLRIVARWRRILTVAEAAAVWPTIAIWGHPEDALAIGLLVYALLMAFDRRWTAAGWLLGAALAMQLLVVMVIPVFIGMLGWRRSLSLLARAAIPPGFLFIAVAVPDFHNAAWALWHQPAVPIANHATPWLAWSPSLGHGLVSGGPGRLLGAAVAIVAGFIAFRRRENLWQVVWLAAAALAARTIFESVMVPYYVMPGLVLALVAGARAGRSTRWLGSCIAGAGLTVVTFTHHGRWEYWLAMSALTVAVLALTWPSQARPNATEAPSAPPGTDDRLGEPIETGNVGAVTWSGHVADSIAR
jgi:hypothetical protein